MKHRTSVFCVWLCASALSVAGAETLMGSETNIESQLRGLQEQNAALQSQIQRQQEQIDALTRKFADRQPAGATNEEPTSGSKGGAETPSTSGGGFNFGKILISGEGGVAFFETGSEGMFPNSEFRVDEARLFVDAPVWGNVYAFAELNLITRESSDAHLQLGECYLDAEDVSQLWGRDRQLNLRAGQFYIPFGEEYLNRYAINNPLITHSLSDLWGVDEGVELYGSVGHFSYVTAVQNGGIPVTRDFNADKSVAGRLSWDPLSWLHMSVSAMRTGDLNVQSDRLSAMWFGGGFFRSLGGPGTTVFHANLVQGDVQWRFPHGHLSAFGGWIEYNDNDPAANNRRDVYYYSAEFVHDLVGGLYAGARVSQIFADDGFPIVGNGATGEYLFGPLTENLWRVSLGLGYRWNRHLVLKTEYALEQGKLVGGVKRDHENLFATEAAFAF